MSYSVLEIEQARRIANLEAELAAARGRFAKADRRIRQIMFPDPYDERDVCVEWLRKEIRAALDAERKP